MKTRYLLPLASLVLAVSAQAAPAPAPAPAQGPLPEHRCDDHHNRHHRHAGPPPGGFLERFDERAGLGLSDAQKQKLKALGEEERARHDAIRQDYQKRFDAVLTKEQRAKLDSERDQARDRHAQRLEQRAEQMKERAQALRGDKPAQR